MESVEASGKSIEDAILQALARLGRNRDEVDISVLQEPSRGVRGMGAREARVRVYVKPGAIPRGVQEEDESFYDDALAEDDGYSAESSGEVEAYAADVYVEGEEEPGLALTTAPLRELLAEDASIEEFAVETLRQILGHMGIQVGIEVEEPPEGLDEEAEDDAPLVINIRSQDQGVLGLLIGRRGETLAALQLLVNLVVSKQTGLREHVIVDAEGYRARREANLRSMALRVANQVRRSGQPMALEAMPPNERRIIHMTLAETDDMATESTGEGDQRRVVVSLRRPIRA
ncbi:MAG TPA: RNA-binding cell elongation regulator Jag/EloR [Ktedonobacterales bacterium]|nr:RNA-binding cell elongation regulator Jag/EloR [Ktedonobacterales bacterium]